MREVVAILRPHDQTLDAAVREITIALGRAADAANKAVSYRVEAGAKLLTLRRRIESGEAGDGVNWWKWYREHFDRSRKDAEKVMALAAGDDPEAEAEEERAKRREQMRQRRAKDKEAQPWGTAHVGGNESGPTNEEIVDGLAAGTSGDACLMRQLEKEHAEGGSTPSDETVLRKRAKEFGFKLQRRGKEYGLFRDDGTGMGGFENIVEVNERLDMIENKVPYTISTACGIPLATITYDENGNAVSTPAKSTIEALEKERAAASAEERKALYAEVEPEDQEPEVADPATIEDNALYTLQRINEHARVFRKLFRASSFDRAQEERISSALEQTIQKLRWAQTALSKKNTAA